MQTRAVIKDITFHLPEQKLTNEQLEAEFKDWSIGKIFEKTGIAVRRIAAPEECASDLACKAAEKLFASGVCTPAEVDFLLFSSQTPDYGLPATACLLQDRLGLPMTAGALDYGVGCSGYIYGLATAKGLVESGLARNVLLLTGETYSKIINPTDRSVRTLFGDGGAATLIAATESLEEQIGPFVLGTDGRGAEKLIVPVGGARHKSSESTKIPQDCGDGIFRSAQELYMDGPEIFNFTLREVPRAVDQLLAKSRKSLEEIDYFVFHQASKFILEQLRRKLKIPKEKFCIELETVGNTVSSSIPIALDMIRHDKKIKNGDTIMLVGFGVGFSWGAALVKFPH